MRERCRERGRRTRELQRRAAEGCRCTRARREPLEHSDEGSKVERAGLEHVERRIARKPCALDDLCQLVQPSADRIGRLAVRSPAPDLVARRKVTRCVDRERLERRVERLCVELGP